MHKLIAACVLLAGICFITDNVNAGMNMFDWKYWKCFLKKSTDCPDNDIRFYLYSHESGTRRKRIDVRNPLALNIAGWNRTKNNVIIIHGFNGTENKSPITILRDAFLTRDDYNVFTVDWKPLTQFPCYLSSLSNTRLVGKCTAQFYAYIMDHGGAARKTTCVGHSLGAHICGIISNHLDVKQHRIVGLDPARPLINEYASHVTRLSPEDAFQVQVIHTNAGFLGEAHQRGHVDFCVNGGNSQPGCKGHWLRISRCSHFQSVCFYAATVRGTHTHMGRPCSSVCPKQSKNWGMKPGKAIPMGINTPLSAKGTFCVDTGVATTRHNECPFDKN
ncbi:phospholipase A1-like [Atheta coriaria]|uniref:phospholipase A1-like n=1 Tax=Dalotia coriaria TaxID=877792 RepID=UPI0031F3DA97